MPKSAWHEAISGAETALSLRRERESSPDGLSAALRARIDRGRAVPAVEYLHARARVFHFDVRKGVRAAFVANQQ